jgi:DHA1 family bicyclomycin/chloramphenicol resistance-like MFS transporter
MIRDLLSGPKAQKMLSDVTIVFAAAPAVAPILGGWLQVWFGWLFISLVSGLVVGATAAGRLAHRWKTARLIKTGYALMSAAALLGLGYNLLFPAQVPWAVMPLFLYTLGMALALNVFPAMRGLAASMQAFLQMLLFALVAGTVAPLIGGNALWLALFHAACVVASLGCMLAITRLPSRFDQTA